MSCPELGNQQGMPFLTWPLGLELNRTNGNCSALLLNEVGKWSCFSVPENNFLFF